MRAAWWGLIGVGVAALFGCNDGRGQLRKLGPVLDFEPAQLDFGDVALGLDAQKPLRVRNDGLVPLSVDAVPGSKAGLAGGNETDFSAAGLPISIEAGKNRDVAVTFKPTAIGDRAENMALLAGTPQPRAFSVRGHAVYGMVSASDAVIDFGDVVRGETATFTWTLGNHDGHARTRIILSDPQGNDAGSFSFQPSGTVYLEPDQDLQVKVSFTPATLGSKSATINFTPCPVCSPKAIALSGAGVLSLVDVKPTEIDFGLLRLGTSAQAGFTLHNHSKKTVTLGSFTPAGSPDFHVTGIQAPLSLAAGQTVAATLTYAATIPEAARGTITFNPDDGAPPVLTATGSGVGPVLVTNPTALRIGPAVPNTTRTAFLTLSNAGYDPQGNLPLVINRLSIQTNDPKAWAIQAPPQPWNIGEPGASGQITVAFTPQGAGDSDATLVIESNDGVHPVVNVPLHSWGRILPPCQYRVLPGRIDDFGNVGLGHPSVQGFELVNVGTDDCIFGEPRMMSGQPVFHWPGDAEPNGRQVPPNGRMSVRPEFLAQTAGQYQGSVELYVSVPGAQTVHVDLVGTGDGGCFSVQPGAVDFGKVPSGTISQTRNAYAVNQCGQPVTVTGVDTSPGPFQVGALQLPAVVQPNTALPIPVSYSPPAPGDDVASLQVFASTSPKAYQAGLTGGTVEQNWIVDQKAPAPSQLDLLIVVGNSSSMAGPQAALQANAGRILERLRSAGIDYHLAVTTTGMNPYSGGDTQCPGGALGGERGRFFPVDGSSPRILTRTTPDAAAVLAHNLSVGTCQWDERFLDPVLAALQPTLSDAVQAPGSSFAADGNAGFLRPGARLALLAVSNSDDDDKAVNPPPVASQLGELSRLKPLDQIDFAGLVALRSCPQARSVGTRYQQLAAQLHGQLEDLCDPAAFGAGLDRALDRLLGPRSANRGKGGPSRSQDPSASDEAAARRHHGKGGAVALGN